MTAPSPQAAPPLSDISQLVDFLASGCKPPTAWRIGTEHEKFMFRKSDLAPVPYEGPGGIRDVLEGMERFGWKPVEEDGHLIALTRPGSGSITLEPGGQIELSGEPLETLHETCVEVAEHRTQLHAVTESLGLGLLNLGFLPKWPRDAVPWMPKARYGIMGDYMPTKGALGLDMMLRTCTVQVNLDFASEADMVEKFQISMALQPIVTAMYANSPFVEGRPSGYLSYRSHVWTDTDPDRCGFLPFVFDADMGFARYVDYMLDVPMYFVRRQGKYIDAAGQSFRDFLARKLPALPGEAPTLDDWEDHLTTAFPDVRMKRFLEMRGAGAGGGPYLCALPAFWVGLLYDAEAQRAALDLVSGWGMDEQANLREDVARKAMAARIHGRAVRDVAGEALKIARAGLCRRARCDHKGRDESHFLDVLDATVAGGVTLAEDLLDRYANRWGGRIESIYEECAY
ncbi:MAG: glutamate--cysteine ligase [Rhodospirillaceae bacterium]|nr:MAG: glutamate--cysteine ligase [Rhodospirillaceae bacterium]